MKRFFPAAFAAAFAVFLLIGSAQAYSGVQTNNKVRWDIDGSSESSVVISSADVLYMPEGIGASIEHFDAPPAISTFGVLNVKVSTTIFLARSTTFISSDMLPLLYPQAISLAAWVNLETATNTFISTAIITGLNAAGNLVRETVTVTTTPRVTTTAFLLISSVTFSKQDSIFSTTTRDIWLAIGSTGTYGLTSDIELAGDVYRINAWGNVCSSCTVNVLRDTISIGNTNAPTVDGIDVFDRRIFSPPRRKKLYQ